jgi:hypothetical protein
MELRKRCSKRPHDWDATLGASARMGAAHTPHAPHAHVAGQQQPLSSRHPAIAMKHSKQRRSLGGAFGARGGGAAGAAAASAAATTSGAVRLGARGEGADSDEAEAVCGMVCLGRAAGGSPHKRSRLAGGGAPAAGAALATAEEAEQSATMDSDTDSSNSAPGAVECECDSQPRWAEGRGPPAPHPMWWWGPPPLLPGMTPVGHAPAPGRPQHPPQPTWHSEGGSGGAGSGGAWSWPPPFWGAGPPPFMPPAPGFFLPPPPPGAAWPGPPFMVMGAPIVQGIPVGPPEYFKSPEQQVERAQQQQPQQQQQEVRGAGPLDKPQQPAASAAAAAGGPAQPAAAAAAAAGPAALQDALRAELAELDIAALRPWVVANYCEVSKGAEGAISFTRSSSDLVIKHPAPCSPSWTQPCAL